ncbi:MAG: hypothetical protein V4556_02725 [Bacteroidota bacterium]
MVDISNIKNFVVKRPQAPTLFGTAAEYDALPETHKDQILFLDKPSSDYLDSFLSDAHIITGGSWAPFEKGNFKQVETFDKFYNNEESWQLLKKWLYNRGISFDTWTFLLEENNEPAIMLTWKMVIKYSHDIFRGSDTVVFDKTLNWCLFYFHENELFFGKDNIYDPADDNKRMEALNERKKRFPDFKHPYL